MKFRTFFALFALAWTHAAFALTAAPAPAMPSWASDPLEIKDCPGVPGVTMSSYVHKTGDATLLVMTFTRDDKKKMHFEVAAFPNETPRRMQVSLYVLDSAAEGWVVVDMMSANESEEEALLLLVRREMGVDMHELLSCIGK